MRLAEGIGLHIHIISKLNMSNSKLSLEKTNKFGEYLDIVQYLVSKDPFQDLCQINNTKLDVCFRHFDYDSEPSCISFKARTCCIVFEKVKFFSINLNLVNYLNLLT